MHCLADKVARKYSAKFCSCNMTLLSLKHRHTRYLLTLHATRVGRYDTQIGMGMGIGNRTKSKTVEWGLGTGLKQEAADSYIYSAHFSKSSRGPRSEFWSQVCTWMW